MFLLDVCDVGRPGGGPEGANLVPVGVLGADSGVGTKVDRIRGVVLLGGDVSTSVADVERFGGRDSGGPSGRGPVIAGDAVWARIGGGGGVAFTASVPPA